MSVMSARESLFVLLSPLRLRPHPGITFSSTSPSVMTVAAVEDNADPMFAGIPLQRPLYTSVKAKDQRDVL